MLAALSQVHPDLFAPPPADDPNPVVAYVSDIRRGGGLPPHSHRRAQLLTIVSGSIAVTTYDGTFVVPAERALWIPAETVHETRHLASTRVHTLYIMPEAAPHLPPSTTVVQVNPLLRAVVDALMQRPRKADGNGVRTHLVGLLLDQITSSRALPLHMPMPRGGVLREIAVSLLDCPTDPRTIDDLSSMAAISVRTLERRFKSETGLSLRTFRRQAKLFKALEMLSAGVSINEISDALGFEGPSAFIAMFKAAFGVSPGRYMKATNLEASSVGG